MGRIKGRRKAEQSSASSFESEDEEPLSSLKKRTKKQNTAARRSPRKTRAAARNVRYNVDESEESDIELDEKESSDFVPSKSTESTEDPSTSIEEIKIDEGSSSVQEVEAATPPNSGKHTKLTPRSSDRLKQKKRKRFRIPSRDEVFDNIVDISPTKTLSEVQPRKLVNNFTKVYNSYNHDPNYTSGESSIEDFIDDESEDERERQRNKLKKDKKKRRKSRIVRPESSSSSESEDDKKQVAKRQMNLFRIDSSDSDPNVPVQPTKRKKLNSSVILDSDSGCEDVNDTQEGECIQIDGVGDNTDSANSAKSACETVVENTEIVEPSDGVANESELKETLNRKHVRDTETKGIGNCSTSTDVVELKSCEVNVKELEHGANDDKTVLDAKVSIPDKNAEPKGGASHTLTKDTSAMVSSCTLQNSVHSRKKETKPEDDEVLICDSDDSLADFIVNSDEEDEENVQPEDENESSESEEEMNISNCQNRRFIASDSESEDENRSKIRKPSSRAKLMEEKRQAHKDKFNVFRKASKKGT